MNCYLTVVTFLNLTREVQTTLRNFGYKLVQFVLLFFFLFISLRIWFYFFIFFFKYKRLNFGLVFFGY